MKVAILENNKVIVREIGEELKTLQEIVGGYIDIPYISKKLWENNIDIIINDDGKCIEGFEPTITVLDNEDNIIDIIYGTCIFAGHDEEGNTIGLSDEQLEILRSMMRFGISIKIGQEYFITKMIRA